MVLVMLDIDEMRLLNEGVGRVAADRALQDIALRLRSGLPASYFVARVSADEYAVAVTDERSPYAIMAEVRQFFDTPFEVEGARIFVSVSVGSVRVARAGDPDEMLRKADIAAHRAKRVPTRNVVYTPELQGTGAPLLVGQLHRAVEQGELVSFFQPIFKYDASRAEWNVVGAESLLRWVHPERGLLAPAQFIDLLERLTISEHVGWSVVESSLAQAAEWRHTIPQFRVWVNLFARQALDRHCARRIGELLERTRMPADALVVEINERIVASDERDVAALALALREMGVHTAIDDFGTGGSSLGRVREVPAGVLKIDRSFVMKSEVDAKAKAVASTVVRLATELGMTVVAEGVENPMQLAAMIETGCEYAQGYALGHPLPADLFGRTFLKLPSAS
jgi:diguanylate cyclase (GGDEF)-like protein